MRMRTILASAAVSTVGIAGLVGCAPTTTGGADGPDSGGVEAVTLTIADHNPPDSAEGRALIAFADEIAAATDDAIVSEIYHAASLIPAEELLSSLGQGMVDAGQVLAGYYPQELPVNFFFSQLGSVPDQPFPLSGLQGLAANTEQYRNAELVAEMDGRKVKVLAASYVPVFPLFCREPVTDLASAAGKSVRTPGGVYNGEVEALGMVVVPMPWADVYEALQRGILDCVVQQPGPVLDGGILELVPHVTPIKTSGYSGAALTFGLDRWNSLSPEVQGIIQEAAFTWASTYEIAALQRFADIAIEGEDLGVEFHDPNELAGPLAEHQAEVVATLIADSTSLSDPEQFVDEYVGLLEEWAAALAPLISSEASSGSAASIRASWAAARDLDFGPALEAIRSGAFGSATN